MIALKHVLHEFIYCLVQRIPWDFSHQTECHMCIDAMTNWLKNNRPKKFYNSINFFPIKDFMNEYVGLEGLSLFLQLVSCVGVAAF